MKCYFILAILFVAQTSFPQTPTKDQITHASGPCKTVLPTNAPDSLDSFHLEKGELYSHSPVASFSIAPDGTVSDVKLVHGSGVRRLDETVVKTVKHWKFKQRPAECGTVVDMQMAVTIDWR